MPSLRVILCFYGLSFIQLLASPDITFQTNDTVAFIGGSDVAAAAHTGHLETLLSVATPGKHLRLRNFGWEGDTVFAQPRDYGFPSLAEHLQKNGVTLAFVQFGRAEALHHDAKAFASAYRTFLDKLPKTIRLVLVIPPPFENAGGLLPNLAQHNPRLEACAVELRRIAAERGLPVLDLYTELKPQPTKLTDDGLQFTPQGHGTVAVAFIKKLGYEARNTVVTDDGSWTDPHLEKLRQIVVKKNELWLHHWRPHNWAFLGGDRVTQPSSRDHRDPQKRWFPGEIERLHELLRVQEEQIHSFVTASDFHIESK